MSQRTENPPHDPQGDDSVMAGTSPPAPFVSTAGRFMDDPDALIGAILAARRRYAAGRLPGEPTWTVTRWTDYAGEVGRLTAGLDAGTLALVVAYLALEVDA